MSWTDIVAWAGLIIGVIALALTLYGIWDVRRQVREMLTLQGNLLCADLIYEVTNDFIVPTKIDLRASPMQKYLMVQRALFPKEYKEDEARAAVRRQGLWLANELCKKGMAEWKPTINHARVQAEIVDAEADTKAGRLRSLFGDKMEGLF